MCGIAGYASIGSERKIDPKYIEPMLDSIIHRGPDDSGTAVFDQVALGNRRLAIIDLEGGRQPITNEDGSITVVYNGEIYNYPELKKEIESRGHVLSTQTDTEVLVHLYEEEGINFLKRLNGMFALALYDARHERLVLARDRFGVKPLVYSYKNGLLTFASEIKALRQHPEFDDSLDPEALAVYLGLFFIPAPWTIYRNVRKLHPGQYLILSKKGMEQGEYFDLDFTEKSNITLEEAEEETARLFRQSVKRQMISDVPVGVLLSGGLDSRSVLAAASEVEPNLASFTISFDECAFNEGTAAAAWAELFQSPHSSYVFHEEDFIQGIFDWQKQVDEPYAPWANVARAKFAQFIRDHNYKVVLGGDGGDELFLGYPTIHAANVARYYRRLLPGFIRNSVIRPIVRRVRAGTGVLPFSFKLKSFVESDHPDLFRNFFGFKEIIRQSEWKKLLTPEAIKMIGEHEAFTAHSQYLPRLEGLHFVDALSYLDFKTFLGGTVFKSGDNAYMASSVEMRVPFMDNDLVDFACRLPVSVRFHPYKLKIVLRRALQKYFKPPEEKRAAMAKQLKGYRKHGFEVPCSAWMDSSDQFKGFLRELLSNSRIAQTGFFLPEAVDTLVNEQCSGIQNNERILQAIISLDLFLDGSYSL